jgi:hypothetical protein
MHNVGEKRRISMNWQLIIGSGGLVGIGAIIFYLGRIVARFEAKFDSGERNLQMLQARTEDKLEGLEERIDERFRGMDKRIVTEFQEIYKRFDKMETKLDRMGTDIQDVKSRLDRLEVRVEERTLRVVGFQKDQHEKVYETV